MTSALPKGWSASSLGELFQLKHGYAFKGKFFSESGPYIVLTPGNFFDEGGFKHKDQEKHYTGEVPGGFILKRGDLIVAMTEQKQGLLGSTAIVPDNNLYLHNQRLGLVKDLNTERSDKKFLYYLFNTHLVRAQIQATANGAKVRHTSPSRIYEVRVSLPPLSDQQKIAAILSAYDDLIENNLRRIKILEEMAQNLYREWFVKFRFPGHEQVRMVDSPLGKIPEDWELQGLKEVAAVNAVSIRKGNAPEEIVYVDIASVSPGSIDKMETMRFADAPSRARRVAKHGDIVWSSVRPNRRSFSLVLEPPPNLIVSTGFAVISPRRVPFTFLYQSITTDDFVSYLVNHAKGAAYPAVNADDFENASIMLPDGELLEKFDQVVQPMAVLINRLKAKNTTLRQTRDLLLPKLISGELNVSELDIANGQEAA